MRAIRKQTSTAARDRQRAGPGSSLIVVVGLTVVLSGCSGSVRATTVGPGAGSGARSQSSSGAPSPTTLDNTAATQAADHPCPVPRDARDGQPQAAIDWVAFVEVNGRMFIRSIEGHPLDPALVGVEVTRVRCHIADIVTDPGYRAQDGDASFLPVGAPVHRFDDANPDLRLAVKDQDGWAVYEASDVPGARTGAGLLDIKTTTAIELLDGDTATRVLGRIDTPAQVRTVVDAVLAAPVTDAGADDRSTLEFVRFVLADGTAVVRVWDRAGKVLAQRITAPDILAQLLPSP